MKHEILIKKIKGFIVKRENALSLKSFVHSLIQFLFFFLLVDSSPCSAMHFLFFATVSSFIKRGIGFH